MENIAVGIVYMALACVSATMIVFQQSTERRFRRRLTGNRVLLAGAMMGWQISAMLALFIVDERFAFYFHGFCVVFASFAAMGMLLYALRFYSLNNYHTASFIAVLSIVPAITTALVVLGNPNEFLYTTDGASGAWFWVQEAYNAVLLVAVCIVALGQLASMPRFYHNSTWVLLSGVALILTGAVLELFQIVNTVWSLSLLGSSLSLIMIYQSSHYNHGLDYLNHARSEVFNELDEPIFITDNEGNVISRNLAARYLLFAAGVDVDEVSFPEIHKKVFGGVRDDKFKGENQKGIDYEIDIMKRGPRIYNVRGKTIADKKGNTIGIMIVCTDMTDDYATIRRIETYTGLDPMTGLFNRNMLEQKKQELDAEDCLPVSVIMCDLNNLKQTNDTKGHSYGDLVIRAAADILTSACPPSAYVGRLGGDEFMVLAPGMSRKQAEKLVQNIYQRMSMTKGNQIQVSMALGLAVRESSDQPWQEIINEADRQMYGKKQVAAN